MLLLGVYVIGTTITSPFVKINAGRSINDDSFLNTLNLVGGGGLNQFSVFALGISPFINASLVMMVLQSRLFPPVYKLSQSGPQGRRKINIITRAITLAISYPQAIFLTQSLSAGGQSSAFISIVPAFGLSESLISYFVLPMILIAASLFVLFISEQITNKGIGNGTSLIIFCGIATRLPSQFSSAYKILVGDLQNEGTFVGIINFSTYILIYLIVLLIITIIYNAERHIPIQQTGAGRSRNIKEMGKLPIKLNPGGIMPVIFAMMVLSFPTMIANVFPGDSAAKFWINHNLQFTQPLGLALLIIITFVFSLLMGIQQSRVDKIAEDFAKSSTFIPGIRPGEETQDYLIGVVFRLSVFSGIYLVILVSMQFVQIMTGVLDAQIAFGGTGMMILVSVSLETIGQVLARRKTTKLAKAKRVTRNNFDPNKKGKGNGLLW
ncbi:preprotein translocase, SecY subunit [Mycoplasmopsis alligatoris A21JP2]|uniref:Protein translocase subunit SecY n=1 Tax=Mycoplasmopsis alligatoris A21JP2 TaxID=747682 RepID=D4XWU2_9BACT|nr:preprotein translocase, SecY subunit [Mycoplasmopsis alligatoris A21JP2]